ncbi:universal stress protein [Mycolicibacterium sphagni]|uniref:Universal stress protein UspA n=1 Tax=Mycolicibacterium sphagni TaxID=1786 RepID=A0A255D577_9MYCO|nr:universal stress protein [Mycolicibacterium sphagni]OYN74449.1 universal stress protein UspA [Mycolicibacterium sphagni]
MSEHQNVAPAVVVGVDGSRAAIDAALWAVDEAVGRDIPLRLVYAIEPDEGRDTDSHDIARKFAAAETAVRCAAVAVESTEKLVKIEAEIVRGRPINALLAASRTAAMLCVGSVGLKHFHDGRIGSTASELAAAAHCPVAVVRDADPVSSAQRWVAVVLDEAGGDAALRHGFDEARLRGTPLRVMAVWQSRYTDIHDDHAVTDGNRCVKAALERRLELWRKNYPEIDVAAVALHASPLRYLVKHSDSIQLLVVAHERGQGIKELLGAPGIAALHHAKCSVLVSEPQNML